MTRHSRRWIVLAGLLGVFALIAAVLPFSGDAVLAQNFGSRNVRAQLTGFEEVPSILSPARGSFEARISNDGAAIDFRLRYVGFTSNVAMAHIHLAQEGVNGPVIVFLCGGPTPACPSPGGEVTGTIVAGDVLAAPAQGLAAGDLLGLLRAIRAGVTYVNVHSANFPGGEIRGQIGRGGNGGSGGGGGDNDDDDD